ncbi:hypothetical protein [Aquibium oceanicum]|nr:hypothetical protein [Aquibium oceanicum]
MAEPADMIMPLLRESRAESIAPSEAIAKRLEQIEPVERVTVSELQK